MTDLVEAYLEKVKATIAEHGWLVQAVGTDPTFFYTVGLCQFDLPEIFLVGNFPFRIATLVINEVGKKMKEEGPVPLHQPVEHILTGYPVHFWEMTPDTAREHCNVLYRLYGHKNDIRVFQMFWPDSNGKFPWEEGCKWRNQLTGINPLSHEPV